MKYCVNISNLFSDFGLEKLEDLSGTIKNGVATAIASAIPLDFIPESS